MARSCHASRTILPFSWHSAASSEPHAHTRRVCAPDSSNAKDWPRHASTAV